MTLTSAHPTTLSYSLLLLLLLILHTTLLITCHPQQASSSPRNKSWQEKLQQNRHRWKGGCCLPLSAFSIEMMRHLHISYSNPNSHPVLKSNKFKLYSDLRHSRIKKIEYFEYQKKCHRMIIMVLPSWRESLEGGFRRHITASSDSKRHKWVRYYRMGTMTKCECYMMRPENVSLLERKCFGGFSVKKLRVGRGISVLQHWDRMNIVGGFVQSITTIPTHHLSKKTLRGEFLADFQSSQRDISCVPIYQRWIMENAGGKMLKLKEYSSFRDEDHHTMEHQFQIPSRCPKHCQEVP